MKDFLEKVPALKQELKAVKSPVLKELNSHIVPIPELADLIRKVIVGIKSLKVKYSQVFGYTIDISKVNLHLAPSDYIRRQTLANAERFVVPELQLWDEKISGAQDKIKALEYQIFL